MPHHRPAMVMGRLVPGRRWGIKAPGAGKSHERRTIPCPASPAGARRCLSFPSVSLRGPQNPQGKTSGVTAGTRFQPLGDGAGIVLGASAGRARLQTGLAGDRRVPGGTGSCRGGGGEWGCSIPSAVSSHTPVTSNAPSPAPPATALPTRHHLPCHLLPHQWGDGQPPAGAGMCFEDVMEGGGMLWVMGVWG